MPSLSIFVLGHDPAQLAAVPTLDGLRVVDLRELGLPPERAGNVYAESRFFLSDAALDVDTDYVGVVSASYDEKFGPRGLLSLTELLGEPLRARLLPRRVFAPAITGPDAEWIERSESIHPGMTVLLREAAELLPDVDLSRPTVFANSFIAALEVYVEFVHEFDRLFGVFTDRYGADFPHGYRCSNCGTVLPDGHGRYQRDRHGSYFLERLTALYFAQPRFEVIGLRREQYWTRAELARQVWRTARGQVARYERDRVR